jgi:hypothetical protein
MTKFRHGADDSLRQSLHNFDAGFDRCILRDSRRLHLDLRLNLRTLSCCGLPREVSVLLGILALLSHDRA